MSEPVPRKINLGSGKDFRPEFLNIDIEDYWSPDIVADVSCDFPPAGRATFRTARYGEVVIAHGEFDEIVSNDVLEHVRDLPATMTNCLNLLRAGGEFNILVPYDLSHGAWQDPTHVRAFNERSFLYYTDWFWYLRWRTHRFVLRRLDFVPSTLGQQLLSAGQAQELVIRTPRAIDSMLVRLEKVELSAQDRQVAAQFTPAGRHAHSPQP